MAGRALLLALDDPAGDAPGQDGWGGDGCRGFALADDDGRRGVADDIEEAIELRARRTEFTWSADGEIRPGWPRGSTERRRAAPG